MIIKESKNWLVISKPSGIHSVKSKTSDAESIEDWLTKHRPEQTKLPECGILHRLDEPTSGCLLVAKNSAAYEDLKAKMQGHQMKKIYHAIVTGKAKDGKFSLYFSSRYKGSKKVSVSKTGKPKELGECEWKVLKAEHGFCLLEVQLLGPGKRHQIRAGLASLGHPIRGDVLYGAHTWKDSFGLHAFSLEWDGIRVECPNLTES